MTTRPERQRGFSLVAAIFIIVALAALGAFVVSVSTTQQVGAALDTQGTQAYAAARSGIEWGVYRALKETTCTATAPVSPVGGMQVTVECTTFPAVEENLGSIYKVVATACNLPAAGTCPGDTANPNYVERRIATIVELEN